MCGAIQLCYEVVSVGIRGSFHGKSPLNRVQYTCNDSPKVDDVAHSTAQHDPTPAASTIFN
jgi:hypothetical protein